MKTTFFATCFATVLVTLTMALTGCGSTPSESTVSPEQRAQQQSAGVKNLPAPAQALSVKGGQEKSRTDALRAKDAAKSAAP